MFGVETTAKIEAKQTEDRLIKAGWTEANARSFASQQEAQKIEAGNKWITENVGLD
jgi:hypothetical protein